MKKTPKSAFAQSVKKVKKGNLQNVSKVSKDSVAKNMATSKLESLANPGTKSPVPTTTSTSKQKGTNKSDTYNKD